VPVEAEVAPGNRQIRCHSHLFTLARNQQSAVVAYAQAQAAELVAACCTGCPAANLADQRKLTFSTGGTGMGLIQVHLMRIGQAAGVSAG